MKIRYCFWIMVQQNHLKKQTNETGLDKNDGNINLIFCCTTFWGNHCNQVISVTLNETSAPVDRYVGPLLVSKLLQLSQVWRVPSPDSMFQLLPERDSLSGPREPQTPIACFSSFHRCSIGFRSHRRPLQNSPMFCS